MFDHSNQARQVLNDAEEDLRDWRLEVDDVRISSHMLDSNLMPNVQNTSNVAESSYDDDETIYTHADAPRAQMNTQMGQSMMGQTQTGQTQMNTTQMSGGSGMTGSGGQIVQDAPTNAQMA